MFDGHLTCSVDIETTGDHFEKHEIWNIAIIPLNYDLKPDPKLRFVNLLIAPKKPENIDWEVMRKIAQTTKVRKAIDEGVKHDFAIDFIQNWFDGLNLAPYKRIIPITSNWAGLDKLFIQGFLGKETFNYMFDGRYRDVMVAASFINDRAEFRCEKKPFENLTLREICKTLGIEVHKSSLHSAFEDAALHAEAYRGLCRMM